MNIIVAVCKDNGIGYRGTIPWILKEDLKRFSKITSDSVIIMGRKTFYSIPYQKRPLRNRINIVITTQANRLMLPSEVIICTDFKSAYNNAKTFNKPIFIIGGSQVYEEAMEHPDLECIYLTKIFASFTCDRFFPEIPDRFKNVLEENYQEENNIGFQYKLYKK